MAKVEKRFGTKGVEESNEAKPKSKFGSGWKPDTSHPKDGDVVDEPSAKLFGAPLVRVSEASLVPFVDTVYDQKESSSCVGHAIAQACNVRFKKLGLRVSPRSRLAAYTYARMLDRIDPENALSDTGSFPRKAFVALRDWGFPSEDHWPFDMSKINDPLPLDVLQKSAAYRVQNWYALPGSMDGRLDQIAQALVCGYPVFFGMDITESFSDYTRGVLHADDLKGSNLGGHAMLIVGFRTENGSKIFTVCNSWGSGWGDGGFVHLHGSALFRPSAGDFRVVQCAMGDAQ